MNREGHSSISGGTNRYLYRDGIIIIIKGGLYKESKYL